MIEKQIVGVGVQFTYALSGFEKARSRISRTCNFWKLLVK